VIFGTADVTSSGAPKKLPSAVAAKSQLQNNPQNQQCRIHSFPSSHLQAQEWSDVPADHAAAFAISDRSDLNPVRLFLKRAMGVPVLQRLSHAVLC
jgi:hypothetical protein